MHPYLNIAIKAARRAGTIILRSMDQMGRVEIDSKGSANDFVTSVDKAVEADIIETISRAYPDHAVLGEESGSSVLGNPKRNEDQVKWIIDPLDGTLNFIHGFPQFSISIAIEVKGVIEHGLVYDPLRDEIFTATKGSGAQLNDRRIRVSNCPNIQVALLATGFSFKRSDENPEQELKAFTNILMSCSDVRRAGSAALDLAYVAAGRLDGYWEKGLKIWDIAAGTLLVKEAGGFVGDFQGGEAFNESGEIVAGTRKVYPSIVKYLA